MGGGVKFGGTEIDSPVRQPLAPGDKVQVGIRPEHLDVSEGHELSLEVSVVEALVATSYVHASLPTGETAIAERRARAPKTGERMTVRFDPHSVRLFTQVGQRIR